MARRLRVRFPGAIYQLVARYDERKTIFHDQGHYERRTRGLKDDVTRRGWKVFAFCCIAPFTSIPARELARWLRRSIREVARAGVILGDVILGDGPKASSAIGRGLEDFVNLTWDATNHDATPSPDSSFQHATPTYHLETDINNNSRHGQNTSGALAR